MRIKAKLKCIKNIDNLNLLFFECLGVEIKVLMLEMNINLNKGEFAYLKVKPTLLWLSAEKCECENVLEVDVLKVKKGEIMANVLCRFGEEVFEVLMLKEYVNFDTKAYLCFKSNFVAVEK